MTMALKEIIQFFGYKKRKSIVPTEKLVVGPGDILKLGCAFWPSRVVQTAIELNLFTVLGDGAMTNSQIRKALKLHDRATPDFTDALLSLGLLCREGSGESALYSNSPETSLYLVEGRETYLGDTLKKYTLGLYRSLINFDRLLKKKGSEIMGFGEIKKACTVEARVRVLRAKHRGLLTKAEQKLSSDHIIELALMFIPSRYLLTAAQMELFTIIKKHESGSMSRKEICKATGIRRSKAALFLDTLVNFGILSREGKGDLVVYSNAPNTNLFLDKLSIEMYVGGILEMFSFRLFKFWADLREALETGMMQNEAKETGWQTFFPQLYQDPVQLDGFMSAMIGISAGHFRKFAVDFKHFTKYRTLLDVGGASGQLASYVAQENKHMRCTTLDLPPVQPIAEKWIEVWGVSNRVKAISRDFLVDPLPKADVITMGMILHDWGYKDKMMLIKKAYDALPPGGCLVSLESIIDDDRRKNTHGLCMSLNMLIEFGSYGGYDFTHSDFREWCLSVGFKKTEFMPLVGPSSAVIAYK